MKQQVLDQMMFLNVDLDIRSKSDLQPLVEAMGSRILDLYVGRENRLFKARLELKHRYAHGRKKGPEARILSFC